MKKGLLVLVCFFSTLCAWSLNYCQTAAFGYGAAATGGGNATPTLVSSYSDLKNALKNSNKVIIITQSITFGDDVIECSKSNITILGMPGVALKAKGSNCGIFKFKSGSNYILRNLVFAGPGSDTQQAPDLLCFEGASKAWVDHCEFKDGADGNFDICKGADNITVSWCRFRYTQEKSHNFSNLIGSSATDIAADGTFNVTYLGCWWDNYCQQRMTRSRNASLHFVNCYWNSSAADYYIGLENSDAYIEGCYFGGSLSGGKIMGTGNSWYKDSKNGYTFVNCHSDKSLPSNVSSRTVVIPTYTYPTPVSYSEAKTMVTNTTCGAGATLTVTTAGAVSSACDEGGDTPGPGPTPPTPPSPVGTTTFWNFSDAAFSGLGTLSASQTIQGLQIAADQTGTIVLDANSKSIDGYSFTSRLKTGGAMTATARYLSFAVTGDCTIEIYCISSKSTETHTMNVAIGTWSNTQQTYDVKGDAIAKYTYSYTGSGTTVYIGSAASGINFYAIKVTYSGTTKLDATTFSTLPDKLMHHGQLFILHHGRYYNVLGQPLH